MQKSVKVSRNVVKVSLSCLLALFLIILYSSTVSATDEYLHYEQLSITHVHEKASGRTNTCYKCESCPNTPTVMSGWAGNPDNTYSNCWLCGQFYRYDGSIPVGTQVPCVGKIYTAQHNETPVIGTITFSVDSTLQATVDVDAISMSDVTYSWSNGDTTNTTRFTSVGTHSCTVTYVDTMSLATKSTTVTYTVVDEESPIVSSVDFSTERVSESVVNVIASDDIGVSEYKLEMN